ncbi:MAG: hypothetical protein HRU20_17730 [Pseudomonadales bacterium]|nr:hypothetical protein [Pseudomonadales bacterium]
MKPLRLFFLMCLYCSLTACVDSFKGFEVAYGDENGIILTTVSSIENMQMAENGLDPVYAKALHPIVLVHGLYGFKDIFGVEYFFRVAEALELGGARVHTVNLAKVNTNQYRGEQLITFLENLQAIHGGDGDYDYSEFHVIGHSHGGPTVRYVLNAKPDLLFSATTIGSPNVYGTSEPVVEAMNDFWTGAIVQLMFNMLGEVIDLVEGNEQAHFAMGAFQSTSESGVADFNIIHHQGLPTDYVSGQDYNCDSSTAATSYTSGPDTVYLYSWSGIAHKTDPLDPIDLFIEAAGKEIEKNNTGERIYSDGFIEKCATHFGNVIRDDYLYNHLDEINNMLDLRNYEETNPLIVFRQHANRLKQCELNAADC